MGSVNFKDGSLLVKKDPRKPIASGCIVSVYISVYKK